MNIAVIGAGAMGGLFSCLLSKENNVTVIDLNTALIDKINKDGFRLTSPEGVPSVYHMHAATSCSGMPEQDLVILFVKSMFSVSALDSNKPIIGPNTFLLSMQNGMGHEDTLIRYADEDHVLLGTTQHNASIEGLAENRHNGRGPNALCNLSGKTEMCAHIAAALTEAGIDTKVDPNVRRMIWNKLFTNISASVLTGILQVKLGFITENPNAYSICKTLIAEAVKTAKADGFDFDLDEKIADVTRVCNNTPTGVTSIYYDLKNGNRTEVDTISGAVLKTARKYGIDVPVTETMVNLVHALEARAKS